MIALIISESLFQFTLHLGLTEAVDTNSATIHVATKLALAFTAANVQ